MEKTAPTKSRYFSSIRLFIIELFSVIIGVLLALMLNQWNEDRTNQKAVQVALTNVANEIQANQSLLEMVHKQNALVFQDQDASDSSDSSDTFTPVIQLQETAWNALQSAGLLTIVDYDILLMLSQVYSIQGIYKSFGSKVVDSYMNIIAMSVLLGNDSDEEALDNQLKENLRMVYNAEEPLLELYQDALNDFDSRGIRPNQSGSD